LHITNHVALQFNLFQLNSNHFQQIINRYNNRAAHTIIILLLLTYCVDTISHNYLYIYIYIRS